MPPAESYDRKVLFRRQFPLTEIPAVASVRITSNSRHILFVNGHEVLRGPIRSSARRLYYDHTDIRSYVRKGNNTFAVLVRYYGFATSWWEPTPMTGAAGAGGFLLEALLDEDTLVSDSTWRARDSSAWQRRRPDNELSPQIPEIFDARNADAGWLRADFDDSSWEFASVLTTHQLGRAPSSKTPSEPFGPLLANPLTPPLPSNRVAHSSWRMHSSTGPADALGAFASALSSLSRNDDTATSKLTALPVDIARGETLVIDLGGIVSGTVSFALAARENARVGVTLVETLAPYALDSANYLEYTARGSHDAYESLEFMGGRYALVVALEDDTTVTDFTVIERTRPRPPGFGFHSDDASLNRLYSVAVRTVDLCSRDAYMDCPTREQRAWVGDSVIHQSVDLTCNPDWSLAIHNVQLLAAPRSDGLLPMVAAADFASRDLVTIPDATLHWTRSVHNLYRYTGDRALVSQLLPIVESALRWFELFQREDGLLHDVTGWVFIDWAPTEVDGAVASLNGLWGRALLDFAEISDWLGDSGRSAWARAAHERLSHGFERFWDPQREIYVDSLQGSERSRRLSEHANSAAVTGGLVPEARWPRIVEILLDRKRIVDAASRMPDSEPALFFRTVLALRHQPNWDVERELVAAQPFFRYVVHDAIALMGRADALTGLLHDWDAMLETGPSALREVWRGQSFAHGWSATPARDLVRYVAGISPGSPGFESVRVAPRLGGLHRLDVSAPSPHGPIRVAVADGSLSVTAPRPVSVIRPDGTAVELPSGTSVVPWPRP
ncbi:MAG: alpha-L-rhamnosidase N-terminal domain-containing protein [Terrimesophilobacter sp.]